MAWVYLLLAGVVEIGFALGLKYTQGFTRPGPSIATLAAAGLSLWLLTQALRRIPIGTAYAVWVGIGATLTVLWGFATGQERPTLARILLLLLLVGSVIGLKVVS